MSTNVTPPVDPANPKPPVDPANPPANPPVDPKDNAKWDEETKAYIKSLREEAAAGRTKSKELNSKVAEQDDRLKKLEKGMKEALGIKDDSEKPEEKARTLAAEKEQAEFRAAVLEHAVSNGIGKDGLDYFQYLVTKEVAALKEGEELSDEKIAEIAKSAKAVSSKGPANTSVGGAPNGGKPPAPGGSGAVSLDTFLGMTITEKSKLYTTQPELYTSLFSAAKKAKKL